MEPRGCNRRQSTANRLTGRSGENSQCVATGCAGCRRLPETFHGKKGVDGSSPSEGLTESVAKRAPQSRAGTDRCSVGDRYLLVSTSSGDDAILEVSDAGRLDRPNLLEPEVGAEAVEEPRAAAEYQRDDVEFELVDEPRRQVLIDDIGAAADNHVLSGRGGPGVVEGDLIPSVTKVNVVSDNVNGSRS